MTRSICAWGLNMISKWYKKAQVYVASSADTVISDLCLLSHYKSLSGPNQYALLVRNPIRSGGDAQTESSTGTPTAHLRQCIAWRAKTAVWHCAQAWHRDIETLRHCVSVRAWHRDIESLTLTLCRTPRLTVLRQSGFTRARRNPWVEPAKNYTWLESTVLNEWPANLNLRIQDATQSFTLFDFSPFPFCHS